VPLPAIPFNIGSIDFPMPQQTHAISRREAASLLAKPLVSSGDAMSGAYPGARNHGSWLRQ